MSAFGPGSFWRDLSSIRDSVSGFVFWRAMIFSSITALVCVAEESLHEKLKVDLAPYEFAGFALSLLLVMRTNSGLERWWEARRLWGMLTNQSRNLAISGLTFGPNDPRWRQELVRWTTVFAHVARRSLRGEREFPEVAAIVGVEGASRIARAVHMPSYVATVIASILREAMDRDEISWAGFMQVDRERALLIDHIGGCERILKTPLPRAYSIEIRRFIFAFLITLPIPLFMKANMLAPLIAFMIAYPILALDEIGSALQNPFAKENLNSLPLDEICLMIETNLNDLLTDPITLPGSRS